MNDGERDRSRETEEQRITFHRLVKKVSDIIRSEGMKARAERTRQGGPNMRPLEKFERKVMAATLELAGKGELDEITARADQGTSEGTSGAYFTLSRLEGEGFISSQYIRASESEKAKVFFKVTEEGERVLAKALAMAPYEF